MEQEERGISLLEFFKILFGRKLVLLISVIATLIVGILFTTLYYNKNKVNYTSSYSYVSKDLNSGYYADGLSYDYRTLLSLDVFKEIKESDSLFEKLNVEKLYSDGAISLSESKEKIETSTEKDTITIEYKLHYDFVVLKKYFPSGTVAKAFIEKLTNYPLQKEKEIIDSLTYDSYMKSYKTAKSYEQKVNLLLMQKKLLENNYKKLVATYGDVTVNGSSSESVMNSFDIYFKNHDLEGLLNQIDGEGYVLEYNGLSNELNVAKKSLEAEKNQNEVKIAELQSQIQVLVDKVGTSNISSINLDSYNEKIVELTVKNGDLETSINAIDLKLANINSSDETYIAKRSEFETVLEDYYSNLVSFTNEYKNLSSTIIGSNTYVTYSTSSVISQSGGVSIILAIVGSMIFGLIIGCAINLVLDHNKFSPKKEKEVKQE